MNFKELEEKVIQWGKDKGILSKATPLAQCYKTKEEYFELEEAIKHQHLGLYHFTNSKGNLVNTKEEITDSIGDITVTLILQCELQGISFERCIYHSYNEIKDRKGKIINGQFVKE